MNSFASSRSLAALFLVLGGAAAGCQPGAGAGTDDVDAATQALATDGVAAVAADDQSTSALTDATFDTVVSTDPVGAADALVAAPAAAVDASCRSRAKDPNDPDTVIITLHDCTGRFGEHHVSGEVIVHFTEGAGVLHADFTSLGLTFDGRPATHTATADITFAGTERHVAWQGAWDTTTAAGALVAHTSDLTIDVDTATHCRTRNGSAVTTIASIGSREIDSSIQDLVTCRDADGDAGCPTGEVTHTAKVSGREVTVTFDGSDMATFTTSKGATFEKELTCQG